MHVHTRIHVLASMLVLTLQCVIHTLQPSNQPMQTNTPTKCDLDYYKRVNHHRSPPQMSQHYFLRGKNTTNSK